jgi:hypothetical protein
MRTASARFDGLILARRRAIGDTSTTSVPPMNRTWMRAAVVAAIMMGTLVGERGAPTRSTIRNRSAPRAWRGCGRRERSACTHGKSHEKVAHGADAPAALRRAATYLRA